MVLSADRSFLLLCQFFSLKRLMTVLVEQCHHSQPPIWSLVTHSNQKYSIDHYTTYILSISSSFIWFSQIWSSVIIFKLFQSFVSKFVYIDIPRPSRGWGEMGSNKLLETTESQSWREEPRNCEEGLVQEFEEHWWSQHIKINTGLQAARFTIISKVCQ